MRARGAKLDRHRDPRGGGQRRCDAPDDRGAEPRQGGRRADRGRGQQDRRRGRGPRSGARSAHRVRSGGRGVRRRHDVRRHLRQAGSEHRPAAGGRGPDRGRLARPAGQPGAGRAGHRDPIPPQRPGAVSTVLVQRGTLRIGDTMVVGDQVLAVSWAMLDDNDNVEEAVVDPRPGPGSHQRPRRRRQLPGCRRGPHGASDRREARGA